MRILFIGGTKSVGVHAVRRLAAAGHALAVFHRGHHQGDLAPTVWRFHRAGRRSRGNRPFSIWVGGTSLAVAR